jgi:CRISPR-associated endoribonuclease Cas6
MRLYFKTSFNNKPIPWDYQHFLVGAFHKWMGKENKEHDSGPSLYSISWLSGAVTTKKGLSFPDGAYFFFSSHSGDLCDRIISGVRESNELFSGLKVEEITIADRPKFTEREYLYSASPILIRKKEGDKFIHMQWDDEESDNRLTEVIHTKMKIAGLSGNLQIKFDKEYKKAKTKVVNYKDIKNKANVCPVIVEGDPELIRFAYNVGIGESTGATFGSVKL